MIKYYQLPVKLKACMDNTPYADPLDVKISPNPISLEQGSKLYVDYKIHLKKAIEVGSKVKATIKKKILFWIKIPCIPIPGTEVQFTTTLADHSFLDDGNVVALALLILTPISRKHHSQHSLLSLMKFLIDSF